MPAPIVPATSDLIFRVDVMSDDQVQALSDVVTVAQFESSASYSIPLIETGSSSNNQFKLRFECLSGCSTLFITTVGFWGGASGVTGESNAMEFDASTAQNINLQLERADFFRGAIRLPEGLIATGEERFTVSILGSQPVPVVFSQEVQTTEGETAWPFFLGVPPDETGGGWFLRLDCEGCSDALQTGPYFASSVTGELQIIQRSQSFFFRKDNRYTNLSLVPLALSTLPTVIPIISLLLDE